MAVETFSFAFLLLLLLLLLPFPFPFPFPLLLLLADTIMVGDVPVSQSDTAMAKPMASSATNPLRTTRLRLVLRMHSSRGRDTGTKPVLNAACHIPAQMTRSDAAPDRSTATAPRVPGSATR